MPFRSYRRKTYKKRAPKRKIYRRKKRYTRRMGVPSGMPLQRMAKLRYVEQNTQTSTTGGLQTWVWSANGLYDPNISSTGHQPMGFDQWANLFNHYVVLGSKITIRVSQRDGSSNPFYYGVILTDDSSAPYSTYSSYIEAKKGTFRYSAQGQQKPVTVMSKYSAKKFYNITDVKDNLDRIGAPVTANPDDQGYFTTWIQTTNATTQAVEALVVIDYIVMFSEPKDLNAS